MHLGFGCNQLLQLPTISLGLAFTNGAGDASVPFPVPNAPWASGLNVFFQYFAVVPTGSYLGQINFSNGLQIQLAN